MDRDVETDSAADVVVNSLTDHVADLPLDSTIAEQERLEVDTRQDRDHINELRAFVGRNWNCESTQIMLGCMPNELRQWITSDPPVDHASGSAKRSRHR